jgi:hypothetical protein
MRRLRRRKRVKRLVLLISGAAVLAILCIAGAIMI